MKHFIIALFTCTLFLVYSMYCFADDLRKENIGNRVVTERHVSEYGFYIYTINEYDDKAAEIRRKKRPYDVVTTTPAWTNYPLYKQETDKFVEYCRSVFDGYHKGMTVKDMYIYIGHILVDDGTIICTRIKSDVCLFNLYTPREISAIFDNVSAYKYSTPLVLHPKEGYNEANMSIWK
ncbi:MAG: hypothetical protein Q4E63_08400 [Prevotellaceae bacterium]|nr:hypothetical protein [Prevotellaceae bacterium]